MNSDDYSLSENAQQQFYTILENCKYMLGSNNKWKKRINLPGVLSEHFYNIYYSLQESNDLSQLSFLQQGIISTFLLLEEGYDFSQHGNNLEVMGKIIAKRGRQEGREEDGNRLFLDAAESLRTDGEKPPHKDMVRARNYFSDLAQQKLDIKESKIEVELSETHIRIPGFKNSGAYDVFLEKENFRVDIDKEYDKVEIGDIDGVKIKKGYFFDKLAVIEILEGAYIGEQLFSFEGVYSEFKAGCYPYETYYRPRNNQEDIDDIELFQSNLQTSTEKFPGYIKADAKGKLKIHEQGETVRYVWDFGCLHHLVIKKGQDSVETEDIERGQQYNTFISVRTIRTTPWENPYSYE